MEYTDVWKVTKALLVIHSVTNDKMVGNGETYIIGVDFFQTPRRLIQAGCDFQALRFVLLQQLSQKHQGQARIQDVLDQDHVSSPDRSVQILNQSYRAAGLDPFVAGNSYKIERGFNRNTSCQVRQKNGRPFQDTNQQNSLTGEVMAYLRADFRHPGSDLFAPEQHLFFVLFHGLCHSSTYLRQEKERVYTVKTDALHVSLHSHRKLFHRHLWSLPVAGIRLCVLDALSQFSALWHRR